MTVTHKAHFHVLSFMFMKETYHTTSKWPHKNRLRKKGGRKSSLIHTEKIKLRKIMNKKGFDFISSTQTEGVSANSCQQW